MEIKIKWRETGVAHFVLSIIAKKLIAIYLPKIDDKPKKVSGNETQTSSCYR